MIKNIIKQPLLHFLLIGLGLFLLYDFTGKESADESDLKTIVVDKDALLNFMQYRSKAFNRKEFEDRLDQTSGEKLRRLIDDYVREEVLHREALALNLDKDDYVIRRRLVQKLEFINQGFTDGSIDLNKNDIQRYFEGNSDAYYVKPYVTFTHIFFDNERHGREKAEELAKKQIEELNQNRVPFTKATMRGDRFLYHVNYVERTPEYVASHFGPEMTKAVFELEPSDSVWKGPFESPYGFHLVMVTANEAGRYPALEEIYERVKQDAQFAYTKEKTEKTIQDIIESYDIRIVYGKKGKDEQHEKTARSSESVTNKSTQ